MGVSDYSTTPSSNISINSINIGEGCDPGTINDAIRQLMADLRGLFSEQDKSADYTIVASDLMVLTRFTAAATCSLTAAATLGDKFRCIVQADGGAVTIDPGGSETINGASTLALADGEWAILHCDGTGWRGLTSGGALTEAEVKTLYESNSDTNAFTDADQTKLDGIESGADVTDETNVKSALDGATTTGVTPADGDKILLLDASDGDNLKHALKSDLGGGDFVLLETQTASNDASIDFTTNIDSTYERYEIHLDEVIPATDNVHFYLRGSDDGTTFESDSSDYQNATLYGNTNGTNGQTMQAADTEMQPTANECGNSTGEFIQGTVTLYNPSDSKARHKIGWVLQHNDKSGNFEPLVGGSAMVNGGSAFTLQGIQFLYSSGNISSGKFKLYGIK